jgi:hypothetical protein
MEGVAGTVLCILRMREVVCDKLLLIVNARRPNEKKKYKKDPVNGKMCLEKGVAEDETTCV